MKLNLDWARLRFLSIPWLLQLWVGLQSFSISSTFYGISRFSNGLSTRAQATAIVNRRDSSDGIRSLWKTASPVDTASLATSVYSEDGGFLNHFDDEIDDGYEDVRIYAVLQNGVKISDTNYWVINPPKHHRLRHWQETKVSLRGETMRSVQVGDQLVSWQSCWMEGIRILRIFQIFQHLLHRVRSCLARFLHLLVYKE